MSDEARKIIDDMCRAAVEAGGEDYDKATVIMCNLSSERGFDDDLFDDCRDCGARVRYRPYMPPLPKICIACAMGEMG